MPKKKKGGKSESSSSASAFGRSKNASIDPAAIEFHKGDGAAKEAFELGVAVVQGLFTASECSLMLTTPTLKGAEPIADRDEALDFRHEVHRIEKVEDAPVREMIAKAIAAIETIDELYWRGLRSVNRKTMHPEVEYIAYTFKHGLPLPTIEPHVDNSSVITMVAMMVDRDSYTGGQSCFETSRKLWLNKGDAVFFRGELCEHWIEPVESGFRSILQIEMCRMKAGRH